MCPESQAPRSDRIGWRSKARRKRGGNVSEHSEIPRSVSRTLRKIESRPGVHKPRALILASDATPLLDWGDTTLPVAVGGLTKLLTMAMVLRELDRGALTLETRVGDVLPEEAMSGLCVLGGIDHSSSITIAHLLSHRSGITDYFTPPGKNTLSLLQQVTRQESGMVSRPSARNFPPLFREVHSFGGPGARILRDELPSSRGNPDRHNRA